MTHPIYFVEVEGLLHGRRSRWFLETDRDENSANAVRALIRHDNVVKVLEVNEDEGTTRDVTEDMRCEALAGIIPDLCPSDRINAMRDHASDLRKHEAV